MLINTNNYISIPITEILTPKNTSQTNSNRRTIASNNTETPTLAVTVANCLHKYLEEKKNRFSTNNRNTNTHNDSQTNSNIVINKL